MRKLLGRTQWIVVGGRARKENILWVPQVKKKNMVAVGSLRQRSFRVDV